MILRDNYIKQCDFYLKKGKFHNVFGDGWTKWPIEKNKIVL
jgi:hypothetical protein